MAVKPSLALIPSGVKANKVYSVLPADGTGDFDFSRSGSATRINKDGLIETVSSNVSRLNYPMIDGVVSGCPSLLLEPARTNLVQYSEDFTSWINSSSYITSDYGISPDGSQNASRLLFTGTSQTLSKNIGTNGTLSYSIYVKGVKGETINISMASGSDENFLLNGEWQRLSYSDTVSNSTININTFGNKTARDLLIWGVQLEVGSYPTSYIPTNGSTVTRDAESCEQTPPSGIIGQTEGTVYADVNFVGVTEAITNQIFFVREQGSNNGYLFAGFYQGRLNCGMKVGGSLLFDDYFSSALTKGRYKIAISYKSGDTKIYVNGIQTGFKNNSFGVTNFAQIFLNGSAGTNQLGDVNRDFKLYNTRLTDQELIALTS